MDTPEAAASESPVGRLKTLKEWFGWWRFIAGLAAAFAALAAPFIGPDEAGVVGWVAMAFVVAVCVLISVIRQATSAIRYAQDLLTTAGYQKAESRKLAAEKLRKSRFAAVFITVVLSVVAGTSLVLLLWNPIYHLLRTDIPEQIRFEGIGYYDASRDRALLEDSRFIGAIITRLKNEGLAEGRSLKILLGQTAALAHPTPAFKASLSTAGHPYDIAGYAFRRFTRRGRNLYEEISVGYESTGGITLDVPPCEKGDVFLFVGRISLTQEGGSFPTELRGLFKLAVEKPGE